MLASTEVRMRRLMRLENIRNQHVETMKCYIFFNILTLQGQTKKFKRERERERERSKRNGKSIVKCLAQLLV